MTNNNNIENPKFKEKENPFNVPEGYFEQLPGKVMTRIREIEDGVNAKKSRKITLRPYISLAASISGLALIIYIVLQTILGSTLNEYSYTEIDILEEAGIVDDESMIAETYSIDGDGIYSDWDEDAMSYLASNEVDLLHLLENN